MEDATLFQMSSEIVNNLTIFITDLKIAFGEQPLYYDIANGVISYLGMCFGCMISTLINKYDLYSKMKVFIISIIFSMFYVQSFLKFIEPVDGYLSFSCIGGVSFIGGFYAFDLLMGLASRSVKGEASNLLMNILRNLLQRLNNALNVKDTLKNWDKNSPSAKASENENTREDKNKDSDPK